MKVLFFRAEALARAGLSALGAARRDFDAAYALYGDEGAGKAALKAIDTLLDAQEALVEALLAVYGAYNFLDGIIGADLDSRSKTIARVSMPPERIRAFLADCAVQRKREVDAAVAAGLEDAAAQVQERDARPE